MTTVELQAAIRDAIQPLSLSVEKLTDKFDEHRVEMAKDVTEIKTDIRYLKDSQKKADDQIDDLREKTASMKVQGGEPKASVAPAVSKNSSTSIRIPVPSKMIPWLVMAVMFGAALAGGLLFGGGKVAVPAQAAPPAVSPTDIEKASAVAPISDTTRRAADATKKAAEAARAASEAWYAPQESE